MAATRRHFFSRKPVWDLARIVRQRQPAGELTIMPRPLDPSRDLLFGLLALQNGLINQAQLVAAFQAWTRAKARPLADLLAAQGAISAPCLTLVEALVAEHLQAPRRRPRAEPRRPPRRPLHPREPGAARRSPTSTPPSPTSARARPSTTTTPTAPPPTPSARPPPTASGSASSGPTPAAAWAPSSSPSTPSCTARWP